ncbi:outer membrane beta-barrel protein [Patescibacteria group bacterium]|nr:outer membrane beta-barrel protein [Patescibacteria group bacterium]MBP9709475.1 outer membrane beta-barrel protein [Patescibacteria group bacterium]
MVSPSQSKSTCLGLFLLVLALSVLVPKQGNGQARFEVTPSGALELVYGAHLGDPSNGIVPYRLNDGRDRTLLLSQLVLALDASYGPVSIRVAAQVGTVGDTYYLGEPFSPGGGTVTDTGATNWRNIQEAFAEFLTGRIKWGAGVFLSPVGPESMVTNGGSNTPLGSETPAVANATLSRGLAFYGLPFYHTGVRAIVDLGHGFSLRFWAINGWNSIGLDTNRVPTAVVNFQYGSPRLSWSILAMVGPERASGAPEGPVVRALFDSWLQWHPAPTLGFVAQLNGGVEPTRFGSSGWMVGSLAARWHPLRWLYIAARGEYFREWMGANETGRANPIFWGGAEAVASATGTIGFRPHAQVLVRLEYRQDWSARAPLFYRSQVMGDGSAMSPYVPNADTQRTVTLSTNVWF